MKTGPRSGNYVPPAPPSSPWDEWGDLPSEIIRLIRSRDRQGEDCTTDALADELGETLATIRECVEALRRLGPVRCRSNGAVSLSFWATDRELAAVIG